MATHATPFLQQQVSGRMLGHVEPPIDTGTTGFMFVSTALVQFMTPGLAVFYAGMQGYKSTVQLMMQNFVCLGLVSCLWVVYVFGLTFGTPMLYIPIGDTNYNLLGNPTTYFMWQGVEIYSALHRASDLVVCCFPGMLFAAYQLMFAVITPALISGGIVDRMHFGPYLLFVTIWLTVVYAPLGYWNWGGGWMFQIGAWDFAGGMVVHESAGFSALGALLVLGPRKFKKGESKPEAHSMPLVLLGTAILWFGWFGFNGGSALTIGGLATISFVNTQLAPGTGMMVWIFWEWCIVGKPTLNGACAGVVAGLVVITPCAGFLQPPMAILAGIIGATWCFWMVEFIKHKFPNLDDACDTFGVHGCAGFLGTIFVGCLSDPAECADAKHAPEWCANPGTCTRSWRQFFIQLLCAVASALYSLVVTYGIVKVMYKSCFSPLLTPEDQLQTQDVPEFGENAYQIGAPIEENEFDYYSSQGGIYYSSQGSHKSQGSATEKQEYVKKLPDDLELKPVNFGQLDDKKRNQIKGQINFLTNGSANGLASSTAATANGFSGSFNNGANGYPTGISSSPMNPRATSSYANGLAAGYAPLFRPAPTRSPIANGYAASYAYPGGE